jgi:hypothetical protein
MGLDRAHFTRANVVWGNWGWPAPAPWDNSQENYKQWANVAMTSNAELKQYSKSYEG